MGGLKKRLRRRVALSLQESAETEHFSRDETQAHSAGTGSEAAGETDLTRAH